MSEIEIIHEPAKARYEARRDVELVGILDYTLDENTIEFTHTVVPPQFGGHGIAGELVRHALDDVRTTDGLRVIPTCDYTRAWMHRHPEYLDLLA